MSVSVRENILKRDQSVGSKVRGRSSAAGWEHSSTATKLTFLSLAAGKEVKDHSEGLSELPGHSQAGGILDKKETSGSDHTVWSGGDTRMELELHQDCRISIGVTGEAA